MCKHGGLAALGEPLARLRKRGQRPDFTAGWKRLGKGHYSEVWEHVAYPGWVFKISGPAGVLAGRSEFDVLTDENGERSMDAWQVFAAYVSKNPHRALARVYCFARLGKGWATAVMPKYEKVEDDEDGNTTSEVRVAMDVWSYQLSGALHPPKWMRGLRDLFFQHKLRDDIHDENIMRDKHGRLVITDPFTYSGLA